MKQRIISISMLIVFLFSAFVGPFSSNNASAFVYAERKPEDIVLDFSFFEMTYESNPEEYHEKASEFFDGCSTLIDYLIGGDLSDLDKYTKCAKALRWGDICDYTSNEKYMAQLEEYFAKYDGNTNSASNGIDAIVYFSGYYGKMFDSTFTKIIDEMFTDASKLDKSQYNQASKLYNNIIKICDAFLIMAEEYQPATDLKNKAQKNLDNLMSNTDSNIFSSEIHKNNLGKILFSKNTIAPDKVTDASFTTSFDANSNIYAIAYLTAPLQDIAPKTSYYTDPNETSTASASVKIDGKDFDYGYIRFKVDVQEYQANKAYVTFELLPNSNSTKGDNLKEWYDFVFSKLTSGKHTITVDISVNSTNVAVGEFEIDWTGADLKKISANVNKCIKISDNYRANNTKVPGVFKEKSKKFKDKSLSDKKIKSVFMNQYSDAKSIMKFVNVGDINDGWGVQKDDWGDPVAKHSTMNTWVIYKSNDGFCYIVEFYLTCKYNYKTKKYGKPYVNTVSKTKIATKNVK